MEKQRKNLLQLFVPICLETLFYMLSGMVDTLMLSTVDDKTVGAIGTANTYIGVFIIMYAIVSNGMMAVMTQNIGAGRPGVAYQARNLGLAFNLILGLLLSAFLYLGANQILLAIGIAPALLEAASTYLKIVGGMSFLNAVIPIFAGYLRAFGYTKQSLTATIVGNVINLLGNALFLFYFHWGVRGVAISTVISKVVNLCIVVFFATKLVKSEISPEREKNKTLFLQIIKVGGPSALETILYNIAMTFVIRYLNQMDSNGFNVSARAYTAQIANFSYCIGAALAQANSIMAGWRIGAQEFEACDKGTRKAAKLGACIAVCLDLVLAFSAPWIMQLFTSDPDMISLVQKLLFIDIALEIGRCTNLVYVQALKTSGDAIFPVILGVSFMFLCAVGGTYFFGIHLGLLAVGAYIGLAMDECVRAVGMYFRWRSGKWKTKRLVK